MSNDHDDDPKKHLDDEIGEYTHQHDPELEKKLKAFNKENKHKTQIKDLSELEEIDSDNKIQPPPFDTESEQDEDNEFEEVTEDFSLSSEPEETEENTEEENEDIDNNFESNEFQDSDYLNQESLSFDDLDENQELDQEEISEETEEEIPLEEDSTPELAPQANIIEETIQEDEEIAAPLSSQTKHENFSDLKNFASNMSYGKVSVKGNPAFSIIIQNIKYKEDSEVIMMHLREHGIINDDNEEIYEKSLSNGSVLLSQLGEYSAIYLAHKFRHLDVDILMGLSDELHESKHYDIKSKGLVSKDNLYQNKREFKKIDTSNLSENDIILTTTQHLDNYEIINYLGVVTEHDVIDLTQLSKLIDESSEHYNQEDEFSNELSQVIDLDLEMYREDSVLKKYRPTLSQTYNQLMLNLRSHAIKLGGNAVIGISFSLSPIQISDDPTGQYKVTCTGNVVITGEMIKRDRPQAD